MRTHTSSILFAVTVAFAVCLVAWWSYFQFQDARNLEQASQLLSDGRIDDAAGALGGSDPAQLGEVARRRQVMFVSEGVAFGLLLILAAVLFYAAIVRESRVRRNQDRFLTGATHELKTPLATIRLGLESLQDPRMPKGRQEQYLHNMIVEVDRLEKGLTNILTAAGLRATNRDLRLEPADLAEDVRQVTRAIRERSAATGVEVHTGRLESVEVQRDAEAMRLILHNLLDNAMKFSSNGNRIEIELSRGNDEACLHVADSGRGMTAKELDKVFEPFYRGADNKLGGTGLGLHLVKELVEAHGGRVEASSAGPDRGSRFLIRLPTHSRSA